MALKRLRAVFLVAALVFPALSAAGAPSDDSLHLTAMMVSRSGSSALINGRFVRPGDRIGEVEVVSIDVRSVVIASEGKQYVLRIGSGIQPIPTRAITPVVSVAAATKERRPAPHIEYSSVRRRATPAAEARHHKVAPGETLSGIVADYLDRDSGLIYQAMQKLYEDHPSAFGGSMNLVFEGSLLRIPNRKELAEVDPSAAAIEVARHIERWKRDAAPRHPSVQLTSVSDENLYGPVVQGETLSLIAERMRPPGVSLNQMMIALYETNPASFGGNINILYEGTSLRIPAAPAFSPRSEEFANEQVERHREAWQTRSAGRDIASTPTDIEGVRELSAMTAGL